MSNFNQINCSFCFLVSFFALHVLLSPVIIPLLLLRKTDSLNWSSFDRADYNRIHHRVYFNNTAQDMKFSLLTFSCNFHRKANNVIYNMLCPYKRNEEKDFFLLFQFAARCKLKKVKTLFYAVTKVTEYDIVFLTLTVLRAANFNLVVLVVSAQCR